MVHPVLSHWRRLLSTLVVVATTLLAARAQAPSLQPILLPTPVSVIANRSVASITATATNSAGDVYIAGSFEGTLQLGTTTMTAVEYTDGFVAKCQAGTGAVQWVMPVTGSHNEAITCLSWHNNALYVGGYSQSLTGIALGGGPSYPGFTGYSPSEGFVAKLLDQGTSVQAGWLYMVRGAGFDNVGALAVAGNRVYVGGSFGSPSLNLLGTQVPNYIVPNSNDLPLDGFVAALVDQGSAAQLAWVQPINGNGGEVVAALAVRGTSVYVGGSWGRTSSGTTGNPGYIGSLMLPASSSRSAFVACLQDNVQTVSPRWVQEVPGNLLGSVSSLALLPGSVYVGGNLVASSTTNGNPAEHYDGYVARLDDAGATAQWSWVRPIATPANEQVQALTSDGSSLYVAATSDAPVIQFGSTQFQNPGAGGLNEEDAFVSRLTARGDFVESYHIGGTKRQAVNGLVVSGNQLYAGGTFVNSAVFGSQLFSAAPSYSAAFLATLAVQPLATRSSAPLPGVQLWPNPAASRAELRLPAGKTAAPFTLRLTDALGRVVWHREAPATAAGSVIGLELGGVAPGVYALRVQQGAAQAVHRLVLE